jgi:hypothetical protein
MLLKLFAVRNYTSYRGFLRLVHVRALSKSARPLGGFFGQNMIFAGLRALNLARF